MSERLTPETDAAEAKRRAEWLHKHKAHKDWIILSVSEIAVIRGELLAVERERDEAREALASREVVIAQQKVITDLLLERDHAMAVLQEIEAARWHTACELRRIATRALGNLTIPTK